MTVTTDDTIADRVAALADQMRLLDSCAVAFSGGVDSAVVAQAAHLFLGDRSIAVTAISPSLADGERSAAEAVARQIGIRHVELMTEEMQNPDYAANRPDRCFHCKTELYRQMTGHLEEWGVRYLVNGTNADDLGDHRPGLRAARDFDVRSPLAAAHLGKSDVRQLAQHWRLPVADKPATPCLSSRIAYGEAVTPERLARVDAAEAWLREQGLLDTRVRLHPGELARLEVHSVDLDRLSHEPLRSGIVDKMLELGFQFVTLDLQGRRSGSLNTLVPIEQLERGPSSD